MADNSANNKRIAKNTFSKMLKTVKRISLIYKINTVKKLVYYLYEEGSRARKVIGNFLSGFKGAIKIDGYNAYKIFEGERRMKPVVLGRKNYMNCSSQQEASNGAYMLYAGGKLQDEWLVTCRLYQGRAMLFNQGKNRLSASY